MARYVDLTGRKFGLLTVTEYAGNAPSGRAQWGCRCECGGEKIAQAEYLKDGSTSSCGCLGLVQRRANALTQRHEGSKRNRRREYASWQSMNDRCYKPSASGFANYGGRGIGVCDQWRNSFAAFLSDMGSRPEGMSIDRVENSADYSPDNCRWSTRKEQANNRRNNRIVSLDGVTLNVQQWAERMGISCHVIHTRLYLGWDERDAVLRSVGHHQPR